MEDRAACLVSLATSSIRAQAAFRADLVGRNMKRIENLRIPIYSGRVFRREAGHRSDLKPATIPK